MLAKRIFRIYYNRVLLYCEIIMSDHNVGQKTSFWKWLKRPYGIIGIILTLVSVILVGLELYEKYLAHTHCYKCFDNFVENRSLEIPVAPGIPSIVFFRTTLTKEEFDIYELNLLVSEILSEFELRSYLNTTKPTKRERVVWLLAISRI